MNDRTSKMLTRTQELAANAREKAAVELLAWEKVEVIIRVAAAAGATRVVLSPAKPIQISKTIAAAAVRAKLDQLGFKSQWLSRRDKAGEPEIHDLEVTW